MKEYTLRPDVVNRLKLIAAQFDNTIVDISSDWLARILFWCDPENEYITWFKIACCDEDGKWYKVDGTYNAETKEICTSKNAKRAFLHYSSNERIFRDAIVKLLVDIIDMFSFELDLIVIDLSAKNFSKVKVYENEENQYCLGITGHSAEAKDSWGFTAMANVVGNFMASI